MINPNVKKIICNGLPRPGSGRSRPSWSRSFLIESRNRQHTGADQNRFGKQTMDIGKKGVFWFTDTLNPTQPIELAQRTEQLGYRVVVPGGSRYECFALGSFLLPHTKFIIASGIANIYARDPTATNRGQQTLAKLSDGSFLFGLGVSIPSSSRRRVVTIPPACGDHADLSRGDGQGGAIAPALEEPPPTLAALGPQMTAPRRGADRRGFAI